MTVKPAVFALLAVGGLGAAGVGGYLAVSSAVPPTPVATHTAAPATPAVSETEAIVAPTEPVEAPAESAAITSRESSSPAASRPAERSAVPARGSSRTAASEPVEAPRRTAPAPGRGETPRTASATPSPRTAPAPVETRPTSPSAPTVARDETPRPTSEPAREPAPVAVEASREPARQAEAEESRASSEPPAPRTEEFVVPADSVIGLRLEDTISSDTARVEQRVEARVTRDVRVNGTIVIPSGTRARGEVTLVEPGGRFKERARLGIRFHTLVLADGSSVPIETETLYREGDEVGKKAATRIGASAVGGAIVGAIFGGGRGAAIGAAAGAGAGTAATVAGQRSTATLPSGSTVTVRLTGPAAVPLEP